MMFADQLFRPCFMRDVEELRLIEIELFELSESSRYSGANEINCLKKRSFSSMLFPYADLIDDIDAGFWFLLAGVGSSDRVGEVSGGGCNG